jgi:hypothetical protein
MNNDQLAMSIKSLHITANFDMLILQFALIFEKELGRGAKPGIDSHLPRGKNCRGHLEDENDSQGHGRPLPCPLNYLMIHHKVTPQFLNINLSVKG